MSEAITEPYSGTPSGAAPEEKEVRHILKALKGLRFGSVEVIVQDARIVQIQRLEKKRLV